MSCHILLRIDLGFSKGFLISGVSMIASSSWLELRAYILVIGTDSHDRGVVNSHDRGEKTE